MAALFAATAVVVPFENLGVPAVDSVGWKKMRVITIPNSSRQRLSWPSMDVITVC